MPVQAALFDLDGVISDTASVHSKAWKAVFDQFLGRQATAHAPFSDPDDYIRHLDGRTRLAGIAGFLLSRGIILPFGQPDDDGLDSVCGIATVKNAIFRDLLSRDGVTIFPDAVRLMARCEEAGLRLGLASSSKNARVILEKAGLSGRFPVIMDGLRAEDDGVASKPDAAFYRHAAMLSGLDPADCLVIEDAVSGVVSARRAGIGAVIGISRGEHGHLLRANGADLVMLSLDDLDVSRVASIIKRGELCASTP